MERPKWWRLFDAKLTLPLLIIIFFLALIGVGNLFGTYQFFVTGNVVGGILALFSALLYFAPAYGLLKLKRWARFLELFLSLFLVGLGFILIFTGISNRELFNLATQGVMITVIHGSIAVYLLTDRCRKAFGYMVREKETPAPAGTADESSAKSIEKTKEQAD